MLLVQHRNGIGTHHLVQRQLHRRPQIAFRGPLRVFNQLDQHLRVGGGAEGVTVLHQPLLQQGIVFNDAVVDDGQLLRFRKMGMCVHLVRLPVGCPAGMCDADMAADVLVFGKFLQFGNLSLGLVDVQLALRIDERHAGTVITSVFQPVKTLDQDGIGIPVSDISYYSTHNNIVLNY